MRAACSATLMFAAVASGSAMAAERPVPPPGDHVAACPEHGPGFFRIPGTQSCMRLGGRVTSEYGIAARRVRRDDIAGFGTSARVSADVRTDTAYGPLRSFVRIKVGQGATSRN